MFSCVSVAVYVVKIPIVILLIILTHILHTFLLLIHIGQGQIILIVFMCFSSCICCQNPYSYPVDNFNSYSPYLLLKLLFDSILSHWSRTNYFVSTHILHTFVLKIAVVNLTLIQSCHIGQGQIILIVFMCFSSCICCQNPYSYPVDNFNSYSPYLRIFF